ncbi:DUF3679 domain-containing protein [Bacillus chungangensis]|uniref:DUF3679 domain-containing protein n=1 Tax=Bacillus chungangensis TaxID=587633 RepID=A0ABT9WLT5_9BACI|nr:DUF3679 domain-containing protein [Bacillus chungangensis]MDQ0174201.1 hypothetical protein [Bacillus chungangensis]
MEEKNSINEEQRKMGSKPINEGMMKLKRFFLKCLLLITLLFLGVLVGMQHANQKMIEMKGYNDQSFRSPFMIKENKDGEMEATVLGNSIASTPKDGDYEDYKEITHQQKKNLFSQLAQWLSTMLTTLIENILEGIAALF